MVGGTKQTSTKHYPYELASFRTTSTEGGTAILVKNNIKSTHLNYHTRVPCMEGTFEYSALEVQKFRR